MTAILRRLGYRVVCVLAPAIVVLTGGALVRCAQAGAATDPHLLHMRHLEHLAHIRSTRKAGHSRAWKLEIPVIGVSAGLLTVSYTHLRAHETRHDIVCRLL